MLCETKHLGLMEGSSNSGSRKQKSREMPLRQVVLALPAPSALTPPHLHTTTTKLAGDREKPKEVVLAHSAPNAPPPPIYTTTKSAGTRKKPKEVVLDRCAPNAPAPPLQTTTTTKRAGTREKEEEVALALSLPNAPPPPLNITTAATSDGTKSDYSLRQKRKQEEGAAAPALQEPAKKKPRLEVVRVLFLDPDATESSSDDDYTPPVTNGRKRKEDEIVHEIKILGKNPNSKRRKTQETITKTTRKKIKDQKNEEKLVGRSCGEKVKKSSSTTASKKETKTKEKKEKKKKKETKKKTTEVVDVLWDIPGEIPDLDLLEQEKHRLLYRFFDGIPED